VSGTEHRHSHGRNGGEIGKKNREGIAPGRLRRRKPSVKWKTEKEVGNQSSEKITSLKRKRKKGKKGKDGGLVREKEKSKSHVVEKGGTGKNIWVDT